MICKRSSICLAVIVVRGLIFFVDSVLPNVSGDLSNHLGGAKAQDALFLL